MTFIIEEMTEAAGEAVWNFAKPLTAHECVIANVFFNQGALWAAKNAEEARRCKIKNHSAEWHYEHTCGNCNRIVEPCQNFCSQCGYKFIKEGE